MKHIPSNFQILRLSNHIDWVKEVITEHQKGNKTKNLVLIQRMKNELIHHSHEAYKNMKFRDALKYSWYDFQQIRDDYRVDGK